MDSGEWNIGGLCSSLMIALVCFLLSSSFSVFYLITFTFFFFFFFFIVKTSVFIFLHV